MPEINPQKLYGFAEAAKAIPSPHGGKEHVSVATLHRWRLRGLVRAEARHVGHRRYWFIWGSQLAKLLPAAPPPEAPRARTVARRQKDYERACAELRALGVK